MYKHKEKIFELREQGKSYKEISETLNCSKGTISYHLGHEQKNKTRNRRQESNARFKERIKKIKELSGCIDCKKKYPHYVLEFDHLPNEEKIGNIYKVFISYGLQAALKEIDKCEIVCANCHSHRTWDRKPW
jgi:hypothetical protein